MTNCDGIVGHYSPVMPTGQLRACKTSFGLLALFLLLVPYNKQLINNLDRSVVTGKSRTSAYRIAAGIVVVVVVFFLYPPLTPHEDERMKDSGHPCLNWGRNVGENSMLY